MLPHVVLHVAHILDLVASQLQFPDVGTEVVWNVVQISGLAHGTLSLARADRPTGAAQGEDGGDQQSRHCHQGEGEHHSN